MTHPFAQLSPDCILDAVEALGQRCDGRVLALNSYENRVYQVGIEDSQPLIVKFYRPDRWNREQILEEHAFCDELVEAELPVVAPLRDAAGQSLHNWGEFPVALFPRRGGQAPDLDDPDTLLMLGRLLGRIHALGAARPYRHRPQLSLSEFGDDSVDFLVTTLIPPELRASYGSLCRDLLARIRERLGDDYDRACIRVHGDLHRGNILWRDGYFNLVDLDDSRQAPAIQDLWMLLSGDRLQQQAQLGELLEGYEEFHDFDDRQLAWIEPLRTLRMMHYAAWLGRRWDDPAFPAAFPWFNTPRYWGEHVLELREQLSLLNEAPLRRAP